MVSERFGCAPWLGAPDSASAAATFWLLGNAGEVRAVTSTHLTLRAGAEVDFAVRGADQVAPTVGIGAAISPNAGEPACDLTSGAAAGGTVTILALVAAATTTAAADWGRVGGHQAWSPDQRRGGTDGEAA